MRTLLDFLVSPEGQRQTPEERRQFLEAVAKDRSDYRDELDRVTAHHRAMREESDKGAITVAQGGMRTGLILNGGGLVGIPAMVAVFGLDAAGARGWLVAIVALFLLGLAIAWLSNLFAFFALATRADASQMLADAAERNLTNNRWGAPKEDQTKAAQDEEAEGNRLWTRFQRQRAAAIVACLASFVLFANGAIVGGFAVVKAPARGLGAASAAPPAVAGAPTAGR